MMFSTQSIKLSICHHVALHWWQNFFLLMQYWLCFCFCCC